MANLYEGIDISDIKAENDTRDTGGDNMYSGIDISDIINTPTIEEPQQDNSLRHKLLTVAAKTVLRTVPGLAPIVGISDISNITEEPVSSIFANIEEPNVIREQLTPEEQAREVFEQQKKKLLEGRYGMYTGLAANYMEANYPDMAISSVNIPVDLIVENHKKEQLAVEEKEAGTYDYGTDVAGFLAQSLVAAGTYGAVQPPKLEDYKHSTKPTVSNVIKEGVESGALGTVWHANDYFPTSPGYTEALYEQLPGWKKALYNISAVSADLPVYSAAAVVTTPLEMIPVAGPYMHAGATFAIPGVIRRHYATKIQVGDVDNWNDYWHDYMKPDLQTAAKEGIVGAVTFGVNKYTGNITSKYADKLMDKYTTTYGGRLGIKAGQKAVTFAVDDAAFTLTGDVLHHQAPSLEQFVDNAVVLSFIHGQNKLQNRAISGINTKIAEHKANKLVDIYRKGNFLSLDNINKIFKENPQAFDDFMSLNTDIPDIFKIDSERKVVELKINQADVKQSKEKVITTRKKVDASFDELMTLLQKSTDNMLDLETSKATSEKIQQMFTNKDSDINTVLKSAADYYYKIGLLEPDAATTDMGTLIIKNMRIEEEYSKLVDEITTLRGKLLKEPITNPDETRFVNMVEDADAQRNAIVQLKEKYNAILPLIKSLKVLEGMKDKMMGLDRSNAMMKEYRYSYKFNPWVDENNKIVDNTLKSVYARNREEALEKIIKAEEREPVRTGPLTAEDLRFMKALRKDFDAALTELATLKDALAANAPKFNYSNLQYKLALLYQEKFPDIVNKYSLTNETFEKRVVEHQDVLGYINALYTKLIMDTKITADGIVPKLDVLTKKKILTEEELALQNKLKADLIETNKTLSAGLDSFILEVDNYLTDVVPAQNNERPSELKFFYELSAESAMVKDVLEDTVLSSYINKTTFNDIFLTTKKETDVAMELEANRNRSVADHKTMVDSFNQWMAEFKKPFQTLPKTASYSKLRFKLYMLDKMNSVKAEEVINSLDTMVGKLSKEELTLFEHAVIMKDELETIKINISNAKDANKKLSASELKAMFPERVHTTAWFQGMSLSEIVNYAQQRIREAESNPAIKRALEGDKAYMDSIRTALIKSAKARGIDLTGKLSKNEYFRRITVEYANSKIKSGKAQVGANKSYMMARTKTGTVSPFETNYRIARYEIAHKLLMDIEINKLLVFLEQEYSRPRKLALLNKLKENINIGANYKNVSWKSFIDQTKESIWDADRMGSNFTEEDAIINKHIEDSIKKYLETEKKLTEDTTKTPEEKEQLKEQLLNKLLGKNPEMSDENFILQESAEFSQVLLLPNEIIESLNTITQVYTKSNPWRKGIGLWKQWQIMNPKTALKYNIRNMEGDFEAVVAGNLHTLTKIKEAWADMVAAAEGNFSENMKEYRSRGGNLNTLLQQEINEGKYQSVSEYFIKQDAGSKNHNLVKSWFDKAFQASNARETLLRYATFLSYKEQAQRNQFGAPDNFGASSPKEVMALSDINDRAFVLSNDLLGAYDRIGPFSVWMRQTMYPFWSWTAVNAKRSLRLARNALMYNKDMRELGIKVVNKTTLPAALKVSTVVAMKLGQLVFAATALQSIAQVYNNIMFTEEEQDLPQNIKDSFHIILGRTEAGEVSYFSNLGAFNDAFQWLNVDTIPNTLGDLLSRGMSMEDAVVKYVDDEFSVFKTGEKFLKNLTNKFVQGFGPQIKLPIELAWKKTIFPDMWNAKTVQDRTAYIFQSLRLEEEYKMIANRLGINYPLKDNYFGRLLKNTLVYSADPYQSAYFNTISKVRSYKEKVGESFIASNKTPKGEALYNYRLSVLYGDDAAAELFYEKYMEAGGTTKTLKQSLENMHPLNGLSKNQRTELLTSLTDAEFDEYTQALDYYLALSVGDVEGIKEGDPSGLPKYIAYFKKLFSTEEDAADDTDTSTLDSIKNWWTNMRASNEAKYEEWLSKHNVAHKQITKEDIDKVAGLAMAGVNITGELKTVEEILAKLGNSGKVILAKTPRTITNAKDIATLEKEFETLPEAFKNTVKQVEPLFKNNPELVNDIEKLSFKQKKRLATKVTNTIEKEFGKLGEELEYNGVKNELPYTSKDVEDAINYTIQTLGKSQVDKKITAASKVVEEVNNKSMDDILKELEAILKRGK